MCFGIQRAGIGGRIETRMKFSARAVLWMEKRWDGILYNRRIESGKSYDEGRLGKVANLLSFN